MTEQGKCPLLSFAHVAILGDSQYKYLKEHFPQGPHAPYIRHLSGAQTLDILPLVCDTPEDTTHFIINVGTNNLNTQNATETIESMNDVIRTIQAARPNAHITVTTVTPRLQNKHRPLIYQTNSLMKHNEEINKLNSLIFNLRHFHKNVDTMHHAEIHETPHEHLAWDGLHLNHTGIQLVAQHIKSFIKDKYRKTLVKSTPGPTSTESAARATLNNTSVIVIPRTQTTECETRHRTHTTPKTKSTAVQTDKTVTDNTKATAEIFTQTPTRQPTHTHTQTETELELSEACAKKPTTQKRTPRKSTRQKTNK